MPRCAGKKEDGSPCERIVGASHSYCYSPAISAFALLRPPLEAFRRTEQGKRGDSGAQSAAKETRRGRPLRRGGAGAATAVNQIINSQARLLELERKIKETEELEARLEALEAVLKTRRSG